MSDPIAGPNPPTAQDSLKKIISLAGLPASAAEGVQIEGTDPVWPTRYRVVAPGAAVMAACGVAAAELWKQKTGRQQTVRVEKNAVAAALRGSRYLKINGEKRKEDEEKITGFYQLRDGRWMYLHCNFWNLRDANLKVLGVPQKREEVEKAVAKWDGIELENTLYERGGCGSFVRSEAEWLKLPQKAAIEKLPLFEIIKIGEAPPQPLPAGDRPLANVRVLDLTRVLAGPTCARTLAEHGADVLRVTREDLADMGATDFDTAIGKLCTHIDLRNAPEAETMQNLLKTCDVFSQSYRPGTLAGRGLGPEALARIKPGIVYVTLSAWSHEGPWSKRRGYDTIVQSANGFAHHGDFNKPKFLPVSAQDYVVGYILAFGAMVALRRRATEGGSWLVRSSLANAGHFIRQHGLVDKAEYENLPDDLPADVMKNLLTEHESPAGRLQHLKPVVQMSETPARWARPSVPRGYNKPEWPARSA